VRYLRGETALEITMDDGGVAESDIYRRRSHLLGDIVNAQPAYVKGSPFSYSAGTDPYYVDFRNLVNGTSGSSGRKGTVYVAANDGMLHAIETDPDHRPYFQTAGLATPEESDDAFDPNGTLNIDPYVGEGAERWAYIPSMVFPTLKRLAEDNYAIKHRYFVDGSPQVGDVCFGHTRSSPCSGVDKWHTVIVGGLNAGGRGYYALDVTNPETPQALWELKGGADAACLSDAEANSGSFTGDCNIGLSFGNPLITKRPSDGRWVVLVSSGYNNISPGDGKGYLYVVDAESGRILQRMTTGAGDSTTPSGLARINAWADNALLDNTALAVYGGDLMGNVWRFQLDDTAEVPRYSVTLLANVKDPSNASQPISTRPELGEVQGRRVVFVATGKFLGETDKTTNQRHTIYAIKDPLLGTTTVHDMTRTGTGIAGFVPQVLAEVATDQREVTSPNTVDWGVHSGWYVDLPDGGTGDEAAERVNVDLNLQVGTLVVASNVPSSETCAAGGHGWVNFLDFRTGAGTSSLIGGSLIVGINRVKIGDNTSTIVTKANNEPPETLPDPTPPPGFGGRRVTWRELFVE
jgi:type IV pilus assembly protein PilY1